MIENTTKWVVAQSLIGGMPLGFEEAFGIPPSAIITAGFSNDKHYIQYMNDTRKLDIPIINMKADYETFISEEDENTYNELCVDVDVLMHVAACAGLSAMNSSNSGSKARGDADNEQNQNMYNLSKLGFRMKAKVVSFENAPAAYTKAGVDTIDKLKGFAEEFNYSTQLIKTDTKFHGIPQARQRTFIMFYKDKDVPIFKYENKDRSLLGAYLKEIPEDSKHQDIFVGDIKTSLYEFVLHHTGKDTFLDAVNSISNLKPKTVTAFMATEAIGFEKALEYLKDRDKHAYAVVEKAKNKRDAGKNYWDSTPYTPHRGELCNAVVGKHIHLCINPNEERSLSIREMMHLMGLPHDFEMINPKRNWNHICQNVPKSTAQYIGNEIKQSLEGNRESSGVKFLKQDNTRKSIDSQIAINNWWWEECVS